MYLCEVKTFAMELFYADRVADGLFELRDDEFRHCCKVLRHKAGDTVFVIDGSGDLFECVVDGVYSSRAELSVRSVTENFGSHAYSLCAAVAPTKNSDRYEWFLEKAVEMGLDRCVPLVCEHSERRSVKAERLERVALSAAKQSLKGKVPEISPETGFRDFVSSMSRFSGVKAIAYCGDEYPKVPFHDLLCGKSSASANADVSEGVVFLIGPEGDFSSEEVAAAVEAGFVPVTLGSSRLRTETAAVLSVAAVYMVLGK